MTASLLVTQLFRELECRGVRYAVLRNYEQLPELARDDDSGATTDIDLVIDSRDLDLWRSIAAEAAREQGWDALVECDHWRQSRVRHHRIEVFQFYRLSPPAFLQVDVFHAYLVLGLPLVDERGLLEGRVPHANGLVVCVDPVKEAAFKLHQVYAHLKTNPAEPKIQRYRRSLAVARESRQQALDEFLQRYFYDFGPAALGCLVRDDLDVFAWNMGRARARFVIEFFLRHPIHAIWSIANRVREHRLRFRTRQCGRLSRAWAPEERHKRLLRQVMNWLARANVVDDWTERAGSKDLSRKERAIMEQGGLVVEWSDRAGAHIDVPANDDFDSLSASIIRLLAARHQTLYRSATFLERNTGSLKRQPERAMAR